MHEKEENHFRHHGQPHPLSAPFKRARRWQAPQGACFFLRVRISLWRESCLKMANHLELAYSFDGSAVFQKGSQRDVRGVYVHESNTSSRIRRSTLKQTAPQTLPSKVTIDR